MKQTYPKVERELEDYASSLRKRTGDEGDNDPVIGDPIGREALIDALAAEMIPYTPEELIEIANREPEIVNPPDVLIAIHACDTATDDALAKGIATGAKLLVVAPCCQKELRPQLTAPPVLADALRHGIFQERTAEFVTDALRSMLLEWAGYKTKVFEFISTEHTAKNLMIAAIESHPAGTPDDVRADDIRAFAAFYGIRTHALARHFNFPLGAVS